MSNFLFVSLGKILNTELTGYFSVGIVPFQESYYCDCFKYRIKQIKSQEGYHIANDILFIQQSKDHKCQDISKQPQD